VEHEVSVDDVEFALLKQSVNELRRETARLENELEIMKQADKQKLTAGVIALGSIVISLLTYLWFLFNGGKP